MRDRSEALKHWLHWMEWLDRWGDITAGLSRLVLGLLVAGLRLLNDLLLVIILLELFLTVVRFLQTEILTLEPYLAVGIIACTRRVLTASAELSHLTAVTEMQFYQYLMDVGLNVTVIMVLTVGVFLIRKHPQEKL